MRITVLFGLVLTILHLGQAVAQPFVKSWDKAFGGSADDNVESFFLNSDKGYIIGGSSLSGISADKSQPNWDPTLQTQDFWIIRTDSNGTKIWDKRFGGTSSDLILEINPTSDGNIIAGGQSYSAATGDKSQPNWDPNLGSQDYWIIKIDQMGNKLWDKRFGGTLFELFESVEETSDGGFLVAGSSFSPISGDKTVDNWGGWDYWVVKTDSLGSKLWDKRYGGTGDDLLTDAVATPDGGGLLGGYTKSKFSGDHTAGNQGAFDYWVVRIDGNGDLLWEKNFGGNYNDWLFALSPVSGGGFLLGGQSFSEQSGDKSEPNHDPNPTGSDYWVVKIDDNGNKIWDRTIGADEVESLSYIYETSDNDFLLSGESYSDFNGDKTEDNLGIEQTWVVKIDSSGNILWDKTIFTNGHDEKGSAIPLNDLCFTVVNYTAADTGGYKSEFTRGDGDYWMVKLCDITVGIDELNSATLNIFPNPTKNNIQISGLLTLSDYSFVIRSVRGEIVKNGKLTTNTINLTDISKGVYILQLKSKNQSIYKKFIKLE